MHTLYDPDFLPEVPEEIFSPEYLREHCLLEGKAVGRGEAYFFQMDGRHLVLRHFRRGGLIGKVLADQYWGISPEGSRPWREWRLLARLYALGLPVPRPVAAQFNRNGLTYRADLITEKISNSNSLADNLISGNLPNSAWVELGQCIRRFHDLGVYHPDLNARNILLNDHLEPFVIDFDRGQIQIGGAWKKRNLQRLFRSLQKLNRINEKFHFSEENWNYLLSGYQGEN